MKGKEQGTLSEGHRWKDTGWRTDRLLHIDGGKRANMSNVHEKSNGSHKHILSHLEMST